MNLGQAPGAGEGNGAGLVDCHVHVVDPGRYPYDDGPGYRPGADETGTAAELASVLAAHGVAEAVLVQPSCYGTDNASILATLAGGGPARVAVGGVDPEATDEELDALAAAGIVGVRLNAVNMGEDAVAAMQPLLGRLSTRGWTAELQCPAGALSRLARPVLASGMRLVLDHLGLPDVAAGPRDPGFREVLRLGREEGAFMKLSGAFRLSASRFPHADLDSFADAVLTAFGPERCVWGSDWPFVGVAPARRPTYRHTLDMLARWVPDTATREIVGAVTPRRLFPVREKLARA